MKCRRCGAENPDLSRYCSVCGALLPRSLAKPKRTVPRPVIAVAAAVALLAAAYFLVPGFRPASRPAPPDAAAAGEPAPAAAQPDAAVEAAAAPSGLALVIARFSLDRPGPGAPSSLDSVLFDGSWAALPLWAFLGPGAPRLEDSGPSSLAPTWLDWDPPEPVVLCRFEIAGRPRTPELAPYSDTAVLEWRPLGGARTSYAIEPGPLRSAGSFRTFALFREIEPPGVLVQEGRVVGWTFGHGVTRGYLWTPADGAGPKPTVETAALAGLLRAAAPRETAFVQALSLTEEIAPDRRLEAFAAGFRRPASLLPDDLPLALKPPAIAARVSALAATMIAQGMAADAARVLDPELLAAAADLALVKTAARAANSASGFASARRLLSDLRRAPAFRSAPDLRELEALEVELAKSALHQVLNERGSGGLEIFDQAGGLAPDDLELHLLGVEAAVLEKDWVRADELLRDRQYPAALSDKARTLERLIDEARRDEDSVTIRFNPGDRLIPVQAYLNKRLNQKFYIDTGATTTIIPLAAAAALEIRIDNTTPIVGFQGVAGGDLAYQVPLESIEIEGLAVFDIRAIVYDLGGEENAGLLGNDFLRHFQVDLDSTRGILKLRKK